MKIFRSLFAKQHRFTVTFERDIVHYTSDKPTNEEGITWERPRGTAPDLSPDRPDAGDDILRGIYQEEQVPSTNELVWQFP